GPSSRRPRPGENLSLYALAAGWLPLPASADLFGVRRRGARPLRPVGRLLDDARAIAALSPMGHIGHRPLTAERAARRKLVRALALRPLALKSPHRLSNLFEPPRRLARSVLGRLRVPGPR